MAKDISVAAQTQADLENPIYTEIYNIVISSGTTLHFTPTMPASGTSAFSFGGQVYESFNISRSAVKSTADTEIGGLTVRFQNVDQEMGALLLNNDIRGRDVTISGVFLASGTNAPITQNLADTVPVFNGKIGGFTFDEKEINMELTSPITDISVKSPKRFYGKPDFNFTVPILRR